MPTQDFLLNQRVKLSYADYETNILGVAEPDRRPPEEDETRDGYRYLIELRWAPKRVWLTADQLMAVDECGGGSIFDNLVSANDNSR